MNSCFQGSEEKMTSNFIIRFLGRRSVTKIEKEELFLRMNNINIFHY